MLIAKTLPRISHFTAARPRLACLGDARWMSSVSNLSDIDAVDKFRAINSKSLLYFTATWCGPCRAIKPLYEELAKNNPDVAFGKVDVDDNADAAMEYEIQAVPTFVGFVGEEPVARFAGADQNQLQAMIDALNKQ